MLNFGAGLSVTDNGSGEVTVDAGNRSGTSYLCFVSTRGDHLDLHGSQGPAPTTLWLFQDSNANAPTGSPGFISYIAIGSDPSGRPPGSTPGRAPSARLC